MEISKEQAIKILEGDFTGIKLTESESHSDMFAMAYKMAIDALEQSTHTCANCGCNINLKTDRRPYCEYALITLLDSDFCSMWKSGEAE